MADEGVAAGGAAVGTVTASATAITFAVAAGVPGCGAEAAGSVDEAVAEVLPEDDFVVDFAGSALESLDFVLECCAESAFALALAVTFASALAAALASELCWALALRSPEAFLAARSSAAALLDRAASAFAASSARRCDPACACAFEVALRVSAGRLSSTSDPKPPLPCDGSGRGGFGSAA